MMVNSELFLKAPEEQEVRKGVQQAPERRKGHLLTGHEDTAEK